MRASATSKFFPLSVVVQWPKGLMSETVGNCSDTGRSFTGEQADVIRQ